MKLKDLIPDGWPEKIYYQNNREEYDAFLDGEARGINGTIASLDPIKNAEVVVDEIKLRQIICGNDMPGGYTKDQAELGRAIAANLDKILVVEKWKGLK